MGIEPTHGLVIRALVLKAKNDKNRHPHKPLINLIDQL